MTRTNIALTVLLVVAVLLTIATRVDYSRPNFEILPDMKYSPAPSAYEPNSIFANGRTLQQPVEGTIARGHMPIHYEATKEDAVRAGEELTNPFENTEEEPDRLQQSIRRGAETYRIYCVCCHGASGAGDGLVAKRGFPPPPSFLTGKSRQMEKGQLFHILTYGQGSMADFAGQMSVEQRWDAANFVRSMQDAAPAVPTTDEPTTDEPTENDEGEE